MSDIATLTDFADRLKEFMAVSHRHDAPNTLADEAHFNALATRLFELHYAHNRPYAQFCQGRGVVPGKALDWRSIPAVPTASFKEVDWTCLREGERTHWFESSRTTGQKPSRHLHHAESLELYRSSIWPWFATHLLSGSPAASGQFATVCLTPSAHEAPHSSLACMMDLVCARTDGPEAVFGGRVEQDGSWTVDLDRVMRALQESVESSRPVLLLGAAFNFVHLLDYLATANPRFRLPEGSRVMETGGYKGRSRELPRDELHALMGQYLGIEQDHIVCEYGMCELSSQAYDRVAGQGRAGEMEGLEKAEREFRLPPWARFQIIAPETGQPAKRGEPGLLRIYDLANVWSVMGVQTEDLGIQRGNGFELLGRAAAAEPRGCSLMAVD